MTTSSRPFNLRLRGLMSNISPSLFFFILIVAALIAFEIFNYSTTDHALQDLLGGLQFGGIRWSTLLALAFCGIDFAGIARLFTPEQGADEPKEVWYLFGAWLLAATMNAILTWWGVSMAIINHQVQSTAVVDPRTIITVVPVFVAIMVWVIRILIIGTLSMAADRLIHGGARRSSGLRRAPSVQPTLNAPVLNRPSLNQPAAVNQRPSLARAAAAVDSRNNRPNNSFSSRNESQPDNARSYPEPTYHSLSMNGRPNSHANRGTGEGDGNASTGNNQTRKF